MYRRLRGRAARKFARQIGSVLEYCHKNNVVHRDLKIENIIISQTGNIKIIDFGPSNLFNPEDHCSTFCGSLYFAAPELLNAKVYTGPEVDVWSFGVVLYVLVCGKVPFDDQSMPALHAKIKRRLFDSPMWLSQGSLCPPLFAFSTNAQRSSECQHILSRMIVTNPQQRATLAEVLSHPWMIRSFDGPPDPHLVPREPLSVAELDPAVIREMTGFEFGTSDQIHAQLFQVLTSDQYRAAAERWRCSRAGESGSSLGLDANATSTTVSIPSMSTATTSGFHFYHTKFLAFPPPQPTAPGQPPAPEIDSRIPAAEQPDPTRGFHPLVSIYYLVRARLEHERMYGPGHFASSQLSLGEESWAQQGTGARTGRRRDVIGQAERIRKEEEPSTPPPTPPFGYKTGSGDIQTPRATSCLARRFGSVSKRVRSSIERDHLERGRELEGQREREVEDAKTTMGAEVPASSGAGVEVPPSASGGMDADSGNLGMARTGAGLGRGEALVRPKTTTGGTGSGVLIVKEVKKEEGAKQGKAKSQEAERRRRNETAPIAVTVSQADIQCVLDWMQVQHREVQGGFERIHVPSIDLTTIVNAEHANSGGESAPRRSVVRPGLRLSFGTRERHRQLLGRKGRRKRSREGRLQKRRQGRRKGKRRCR
ncbi:serine/threonine-protein kinase KIN2 [Ceratobasidium sp. 414]|nr:serine/threonine-protein kinase KIN2 [Ceratobasidium sp. 414]